MSENRASYPITVMCRTLGVSPSGYHAWVKRSPSSRAVTDAELTEKIRTAHTASKGTYGVPRIQFDLAEVGIRVGRKRVARLDAGGRSRRRQPDPPLRRGLAIYVTLPRGGMRPPRDRLAMPMTMQWP